MTNFTRLATYTILLVGMCLSLCNCSEMHVPTGTSGAQSDSTYIGSWNWVRSVGGFAGRTITPATEGYAIRIELTRDSIDNVYRDGSLMESRRFSIRRCKNPYSPDSVDVISYSFPPEVQVQNISLIGPDTLNLIDQCMDCYNHYYVRAGP